MIYLDNGATTYPKPECVYAAVDDYGRHHAVNAGRGAYAEARAAAAMIRDVKKRLISLCDAREQAEIVLTPSVTIALNQIINGQPWQRGDAAYVSPYEHNAVLRPLHRLCQQQGIRMIELPLAEDLSIDAEETARQFAKVPPKFVSMSAISNVTGYILPAATVFRLAKQYGAFTLLDAAQAMGMLKIRFAQVRADAIAFAGHKTLYAPFGIAGFFIRNGVDLNTYITGGNGVHSLSMDMPSYMPQKMECASMDTVAIAGLQAALQWQPSVHAMEIEQQLMAYVLPKLKKIPGIHIYGAPDSACQAGVISFAVDGWKANEIGAFLDYKYGIAVRAGHHCAALIHRHLQDEAFDGTVRISFSVFTTQAELDVLMEALGELNREVLKKISIDILRGNC
ncbi:MAG: aminotransferase class V-fold PLP-dependent enzyme [Megasphaera sp.]|jgi:cysteine desulfurase family protein|nr:aminotransferase class V-fold PLP-dependent enzyme [Megasphaera sp.]MCH4188281.1 aminotransferase class V-fold PLP-dependent enzyme [Megasphaera sp.]MCH4218029.1 aminotransferase class V-fold PLP-dependent enzyme [Megasphaera sp.]